MSDTRLTEKEQEYFLNIMENDLLFKIKEFVERWGIEGLAYVNKNDPLQMHKDKMHILRHWNALKEEVQNAGCKYKLDEEMVALFKIIEDRVNAQA